MKNIFLYENNQHCSFQMDYNCYPQQPRDSYDYQQKIVIPTSALDISRLNLRQFNFLYPRSSFLGYVDAAQCEYKFVPVDEDMSTNGHFQEQSCEIIQ